MIFISLAVSFASLFMQDSNATYQLFEYARNFYAAMLEDIENAEKYIYFEMYKFSHGEVGMKFRDALTKKAKEGVEVKLLIDSWGAYVNMATFEELLEHGGQVRFFKKIKFFIDFFTKNHRRNHRKILVIDDKIAYIGSANIVEYAFHWREAMLRLKGEIVRSFKKVFEQDFRIYNKYVFEKQSYIRAIHNGSFTILRDVPSMARQRIKKQYLHLIRKAKSEIIIETPYFLPGKFIRKAMTDASARGVSIKVLLPKHSDLRLVDILRNRYLGVMSKRGIHFLFYLPGNLHAKLVLVDRQVFVIGTTNFDYRSFRYQHEVMLMGTEPEVVELIKNHVNVTLMDSEPFNYVYWLRRPFIDKFFEVLLVPFRHLF